MSWWIGHLFCAVRSMLLGWRDKSFSSIVFWLNTLFKILLWLIFNHKINLILKDFDIIFNWRCLATVVRSIDVVNSLLFGFRVQVVLCQWVKNGQAWLQGASGTAEYSGQTVHQHEETVFGLYCAPEGSDESSDRWDDLSLSSFYNVWQKTAFSVSKIHSKFHYLLFRVKLKFGYDSILAIDEYMNGLTDFAFSLQISNLISTTPL